MIENKRIEKLAELIGDIETAMLTTVMEDGSLRSRPMATQPIESPDELWFFSGIESGKMDEIQDEQHVNVSYAKPSEQKYISVSGRAFIVRDKAIIKEKWSPILKAWFPGGEDDPNLALIRIQVDQAEYWDSSSSKMVQAAGIAAAIAKGETYSAGDDAKVEFDG